MNVSELQRFSNWLQASGKKSCTIRAYISRLNGFLEFVERQGNRHQEAGNPPPAIDDLNRLLVHYVHDCQSHGYRQSSVRAIVTAVDTLTLFLHGTTTGDGRILLQRSNQRLNPDSLGLLIQHLKKNCCSKLQLIFFLIIFEGLLPSECVTLRLADIQFDESDSNLQLNPRSRVHIIKLSGHTEQALFGWLDERARMSAQCDKLLLNASGNGITISGIDYLIRYTGHKLHLNLSAKMLRNAAKLNAYNPVS
jgi:integrase